MSGYQNLSSHYHSFSGCKIDPPSFVLDASAAQEHALWAVTEFKQGETIGQQGYWGAFALRKPRHDRRTVELGFDVLVRKGKQQKEVTSTLLLVGDPRCAVTYINDPSVGVAKAKRIRANCKMVQATDSSLMRAGNG